MVEELGHVVFEKHRGWHLDFRVRWPGARRTRRIRIATIPGYGKIESEKEALKVLYRIRAEALDRPLHEVLSWYMGQSAPENAFLHRWNHDFLKAKQRQARQGKLSPTRLRELERYEARGYFDFWKASSIHQVNEGQLDDWVAWMRDKFPHLSDKTIRNCLTDAGTFLRYLRRRGAIVRVPDLPTIEVPEYDPRIPTEEDLLRVHDKIPVNARGLFLVRAFMGLRPSEARRLNLSDVRGNVLVLPSTKTKTKRVRRLELHPIVSEWIGVHRSGAKSWEPLFVNPTAQNEDGRWSPAAERRYWIAACNAAGVAPIKPNEGGRHFFGTVFTAEADSFVVKQWLGHGDIRSTERYRKLETVPIARVLMPRSEAKVAQAWPKGTNRPRN